MKQAFSFFAFLCSALFLNAQVTKIEGSYQGKNLHVQNPFASDGNGFCVTKVEVNGIVTADVINAAAFEIDLKAFGFKIGDKVIIEIYHKADCAPKVLNPEIHTPKCTAGFTDIKISAEGILKWKTVDEVGKLPFVIEQFRWNKWVKLGEVDGKGGAGEHEYEFDLMLYCPHFGQNSVRVKQIAPSSQPCYSKPIYYYPNTPEVTLPVNKVTDRLTFSSLTMYEVYDKDGNLVKKGCADRVDIQNLAPGLYYLNYDNKTIEFIKKK